MHVFVKTLTGKTSCESCAENTFANATASTVCFDCMPDSTSPVESDSVDDCVCDTGHARIGTELEPECSSCAPGKFAGASGCAMEIQAGDEEATLMVQPLGPTAETNGQASGIEGPGDHYLMMQRFYKGDGMQRERN